MISPRQDDIKKFSAYNIEAFADWLRLGLEGLLVDKVGVRYFKPVEYCIYREHSVSADLGIIYDAFPSHQKAMIRKATARLIDQLPAQQKYAPVFRILFDFAAIIQAHEVLFVLPARGEKFLGIERRRCRVATNL